MTEKELNNCKKFQLFTQCATLQLMSFTESESKDVQNLGQPKNMFSGCFYKNRIFSVLHGYEQGDNIAVFINSKNGKPKFQLLNPPYFGESRINDNSTFSEFTIVDFFTSKVNNSSDFCCEVMDDDSGILTRYERFHFNEIAEPNITEKYFFGGQIHCGMDNLSKRIFSEYLIADCEFCGEYNGENINVNGSFYYKFELQKTISSFNELEGCSGAPIFNVEGKLVSILCGGWKDTNYIYGINLNKMKPLFEIDDLL